MQLTSTNLRKVNSRTDNDSIERRSREGNRERGRQRVGEGERERRGGEIGEGGLRKGEVRGREGGD